MNAALEPVREKRAGIVAQPGFVRDVLEAGNEGPGATRLADDVEGRRRDEASSERAWPKASGSRSRPGSSWSSPTRCTLPTFEGPLDLLLHLIRKERDRPPEHPRRGHLPPVPRLPRPDAGARPRGGRRVPLHGGAPRPHQVADGPPAARQPARAGRWRTRARSSSAGSSSTGSSRAWPRRSTSWRRSGSASGRARRPKLEGAEDEETDLSEVSLFDLLTLFKGALDRYRASHPPAMEITHQKFSIREKMEEMVAKVKPRGGAACR